MNMRRGWMFGWVMHNAYRDAGMWNVEGRVVNSGGSKGGEWTVHEIEIERRRMYAICMHVWVVSSPLLSSHSASFHSLLFVPSTTIDADAP